MTKAKLSPLRAGFGVKGLLGALVIGSAVFAPILLVPSHVELWAQLLLLGATFVYVTFAIVKDRSKIFLTVAQSITAAALIVISTLIGAPILVAFGLLAHAVWDLFHLVRRQRYTPWWYAGACVYVDVVAATFLFFQ